MSTIVEFDLATRDVRELDLDGQGPRLDRAAPDRIWWIDLEDGDRARLGDLAAGLGLDEEELHDLAQGGKPGLVERDESLTLTLTGGLGEGGTGERGTFKLHLTERYCLTLSAGPLSFLHELRRIYRREFRYAESPGFVLFLILDTMVEDVARALGPLEDRAQAISDKVYVEFDPVMSAEILKLRGSLFELKRILHPVRDALLRLSGRRMPVITEAGRQSLGDVYVHAQGLEASLDSLRDFVSGLLDSYMAVQAQRLNETMKVLTIFASIILPMTLIAGIYGMNLKMPEMDWEFGYPLALGLMLATGMLVYFLFRRRGWI